MQIYFTITNLKFKLKSIFHFSGPLTIALVLYFNVMVAKWHYHSEEAGVPILHQYYRKLVGDKAAEGTPD